MNCSPTRAGVERSGVDRTQDPDPLAGPGVSLLRLHLLTCTTSWVGRWSETMR